MEFRVFELIYDENAQGSIQLADLLPFKSLVWEDSYDGIGKLQVVFPKSPDALSRIKVGAFGGIGLTENIMYIHSVKYTDREIWAYGCEAKALFKKIGILPHSWSAQQLGGRMPIEEAITRALQWRPIYTFTANTVANASGLGDANLDGDNADNVCDYIIGALKLAKAGLGAKLLANGKLQLTALRGQDVSATVKFSPVLGNMNGMEYSVDDQSYIYRVWAVGVDLNGNEVSSEYHDPVLAPEATYAFLDLREEFPQPEDMSNRDYIEALTTRAQMSQIARYVREKLTVKSIDTERFGTAYRLGDYVGVALPELSVTAKMRVSKATYTCEGNNTKLALALDKAIIN